MSQATLSQPDDNMIPGTTYTFQLNMTGLSWPPSTGDVINALTANAPSFVANVQVTSPFTTTLYNVQFDYSGDGTDVVSDVGQELITALQTGLSKTFVFVGAVPDVASTITVDPSTAAKKVTDTIGSSIHDALDSTTKSIANAAQNVLTPVEIAVGIVVVLVAVLIFTAGKSGGVSGAGFSVGGAK